MIEVRLLGPPRVERDGRPVAFDTRKAVALLAYLALADHPRPRDTLVELLWPDTSPDRARSAFRRTLSTLRSAIGAEHMEATRDHVRLVAGPGLSVDVEQFRRLRASGDTERAVGAFGGEFMEGFAVRGAPGFEDWVRLEDGGLRRELVGALAELASVLENRGDLTAALSVVRRWLSLDPLHEPAHRELIRLLAATGDRAAALAQYRECVRTLSRELGVPPLSETTRLYEAVNRGTFEPLRSTRPAVSSSAPSRLPLVGRGDDLRACLAVHEGVEESGRVVVVEGEAGIGKTRLAEEVLAAARRRGARTLVVRAFEDESGLAYTPVVDALRSRLTDDPTWVADVDDRALGEAARLVPELSDVRAVTPPPPLDGPGGPTRFVAGLWETLVRAAAGERPGIVCVDDAQWADDATLGLLAYGLRRLGGRPVMVLLIWRTPHEHPVLREAVEAARTGGGAIRRLKRLDEGEVGELVRAATGQAPAPSLQRRLAGAAEGVPLLVVEFLATVAPGSDDEWPLPAGVRELLRRRLAPVSETGRQVLAAAAVVGRSFDVRTVRAVSGRGEEETVSVLEELVGRGLLREGDVDYDFSHEQLRAVVYDETSLARRRLLHGRAADALGGSGGAVARHLHLAGREDEAALAYRAAAEQARAVFAHTDALALFRTAVALGHPDTAALHIAIGDVQTITGDYAGALLSLETAAAMAGPELGMIEHRLGQLHHRRGDWTLADTHLRVALDAADSLALRATVTADMALTAHVRGDPEQARVLAGSARDLAERADDPAALCQALNLLGLLATAAGDTDGGFVDLTRSREIAERLRDPNLQVAALNNLALAHRARGELEEATELTTRALDLCRSVGDRHREAALHNNLADLFHDRGRVDDAMTHLKAAVAIFADVGGTDEPRPEVWKLDRW